MLIVTIMPHHHHLDGRICVQLSEMNDTFKNQDISHHADCESNCLTRLIAYRVSVGNSDIQTNFLTALPAKNIVFDFRPKETEAIVLISPQELIYTFEFAGSLSILRAPPYLI